MMGFKYIFKFLSETLGIIIVVAAVIVFSYFDPFGWFEPKAKISSTAILVREVKQIGELITAEYYGEAITSWPATAVANAYASDTVEINRIVFGICHDFRSLDTARTSENWNEGRRMRFYRSHFKDTYVSSPLYEPVITEISETEPNPSIKKNFKGKFWRREEKAIALLYENSPDEIMSSIRQKMKDISRVATLSQKDVESKEAACIGRGIVRAGFDFSKLTSDDFHSSETAKTIFVTNATPKILSVELNPWFIPQRKVKGFEILKLNGKIEESDIRAIKARCKKMIEQQAIKRKIVEEAKRNGEEALLSFFNLVSSEPLERVVIVTDILDQMKFLYDTVKIFSPEQALDVYKKSYRYLQDTTFYAPSPDSLKAFIKKLTSPANNIKISYGLAMQDSLSETVQRKEVPFTIWELDALVKKAVMTDTTKWMSNPEKRAKFHQQYWSDL